MSDIRPCGNNECENTLSAGSALEFCFSCTGLLAKDMVELLEDLSKVLRLEAEFQAFCREKGLPDPHE